VPAFVPDVAVDAGRITEVGRVGERGREELDAGQLLRNRRYSPV
jgi:hypothetical protein